MRKLQESAVSNNGFLPLLSKHHKGYAPDGRQISIACSKFPASIDQCTKTKVIHNGTVHYRRPSVRDNNPRAAAVSKFQGHVRNKYVKQLHLKDTTHFGTAEGARRPLEVLITRLQTYVFLYFSRNELERERLRRYGGGVPSGTPWHLLGRLDSGRASSSVEEALHGSTVDGGMEGDTRTWS